MALQNWWQAHRKKWGPPSAAVEGQTDKGLFNAQVRMVYATANPGLMHGLLVLVVGWTYWGVAPEAGLVLWLSLALGLSGLRTLLVWWFIYTTPRDEDLLLWDRIYLFAVFLTGLVWGLSGFLLYPPDNYIYQVMISFVVGGISASATASLSPRLPAIWLAVSPAMGLLIVGFLMDPTEGHVPMAILLILYFLVLMNIGRSMNRQVVEALSLRFENRDLVVSLEKTVQQLDEARREAERSSRAKTRFLAAASHDLRQPVHALRLFTAALSRKAEADATEREIVDKVDRSLDVIGDLLNSLLDISKLDAEIVEVNEEKIALRGYLSQIINEFEIEAEDKGLSLRLSVPDMDVTSDPSLLGQIVRNLLSNAIRYTSQGGILLAVRRRAGHARIEVWDTGVGIEEPHAQEIFQEFFQLHNAARDHQGGLGLGLSIVKRTCDLLGYQVELCSRPGLGSRFAVPVPLALEQGHLREVHVDLSADADLSGIQVLLVEDDAHSAEAMALLLAKWGARSAHASNIETIDVALRHLGTVPDLILTDYRLPDDKTGSDAIERARTILEKDVPAIIVTGDTGPERLRTLREIGVQWLHKPVQPAQLRSVIRHLVAGQRYD